MTHPNCLLLVASLLASASPALAALHPGDPAPDFQAKASLAGSAITLSLAAELKKGPVVLYFYPAAFTPGCTIEAHAFAEAVARFNALGATVIGVSHDDIDKLNRFSVSECRGQFAVASDPDQHIMKVYDAILPANPLLANRTSYVISPQGVILHSYTDLKPDLHVSKALEALQTWKATTGKLPG
jgi:peroxiredoxin